MTATTRPGEWRRAPVIDEPAPPLERSPGDLLRCVLAAFLLGIVILLAKLAPDGVLGFEMEIIGWFADLPPSVQHLVIGVVQVMSAGASAIVAGWLLARRRFRRIGVLVAGAVAAGCAMWALDRLLDLEPVATGSVVRAGAEPVAQAQFPGSAYLAGAAAAVTIGSPWLGRRWRQAAWALLLVMMLLHSVTGIDAPVDSGVAVAVGWLVGSAALFAFGAPDRRPRTGAVADALARSGVPVTELRVANVDARGSTPYFATDATDRKLFIKVLGADERDADLLFRLYRYLRLKNVGDERPFSTLRRAVEHEGLVALKAAGDGVPTPALVAVAGIDPDGMVLAYQAIEGRSLDAATPEQLTDEVLRDIWKAVGVMQRHRIAHRDLRLANVFLAGDGRPWVIDFGFSELAASDVQLATDIAELLGSTAPVAGARRAATAAVGVLGPALVASALPRLQPLALSTATRRALKARHGLLAELQEVVQQLTGVEQVREAKLERIRPRAVLLVATLAVAVHVLLPQLADLDGIGAMLRAAEWGWVAAVVVMSALSYVGATLGLLGSVPQRLRPLPTFVAQLATTFVNRVTPANAGGMALNVRFLQKQGVDRTVGAAGVGLNTIGGVIAHLCLFVIFLVWAGRSGFGRFKLPSESKLLVAILVVFLLAGALAVAPASRELVRHRAGPILRGVLREITQVARRPGKLLLLLGGSALVTLAYIAALFFSVQTFGGGLRVATIGLVYLAGSAIASAAPTPGGLGAVEAALVAGLTGAGLAPETAVSSVLLFRLATFWLPIAPGGLALAVMRRRAYI